MLRPAALLLLTSLALHAATLRAGVAKTDITPATHEVMWGFEDRLAPAESTLDPLFARILVLEAGTQRLAVVALDLGRSFGEPSLDRLRDSARKSSGLRSAMETVALAPSMNPSNGTTSFSSGPPAITTALSDATLTRETRSVAVPG